MTEENPLEEELSRKVDQVLNTCYRYNTVRGINRRKGLNDEEIQEKREESDYPHYNTEVITNSVLELYYGYKFGSNAETKSLLAAATYAVTGHIIRFRYIQREHIADVFDVSEDTISEYALDMLEMRYFPPNKAEVENRVRHALSRFGRWDESDEDEADENLAQWLNRKATDEE